MTSSPRPPSRLAAPLAITAAFVFVAVTGCGDEGSPETQPAPQVSTFQEGRFDDLPIHPRSDPVGDRTETDGVTTRSFATSGATTREVLSFYEDVLPDRGWTQVGQVERTGPGGHQGDWRSEGYALRVSATEAAGLDFGGQVAEEVTTQYSLVLTPP